MGYINRRVDLKRKRVLDVGCGGGILSESLALAGAQVMAIDAAEGPLKVAKLHGYEAGISVDYRNTTIEHLSVENGDLFDVIMCLEMLEHVPNPESVISSCFKLLKPDSNVFFSTINRSRNRIFSQLSGQNIYLSFCPRALTNMRN